jgi:hypothetical protein
MKTKAYIKLANGSRVVVSIDEALVMPRGTAFWCLDDDRRLCAHPARRDGGSRAHFEFWPYTHCTKVA